MSSWPALRHRLVVALSCILIGIVVLSGSMRSARAVGTDTEVHEYFVLTPVEHSAGRLRVNHTMRVFGPGEFHLSGGELSVGNRLEIEHDGLLRQSGGTLTIDPFAGIVVGQGGTLQIEGGAQSPVTLEVRNGGHIELQGGSLPLNYLYMPVLDAVPSTFVIRAGQLHFAGGLQPGTSALDFRAGPWTLSVGPTIVSLQNATMPDVSSATLVSAPGSLTVLPAGVNASEFASFNAQGLVHVAGTPLTIPVGASFFGAGDLPDLTIVEGGLSAAGLFGQGLHLLNGVQVPAGGLIDINDGTIAVRDHASGVFGGTLRGGRQLNIGAPGGATFTQDGGSIALSATAFSDFQVRIGEVAGESGAYEMRAGTLSVGELRIGRDGVGEFRQHGGNVTGASRSIAFVAIGPNGTYTLDDGLLQFTAFSCAGQFIQNGGVHRTNFAVGLLSTSGAAAHYELNGGAHELAQSLSIGTEPGSRGIYRVAGGQLQTPRLLVGGDYFANGGAQADFEAAGGAVVVDRLDIGVSSSGDASFRITNPAARIEVRQSLEFGGQAKFASAAGAAIHMAGGSLQITSNNPATLTGLNQLEFVFEGGPGNVAAFEAASRDVGAALAGLSQNFALGRLTIGGQAVGRVQLRDVFDNSPGADAVYVHTLTVGPDSALDLNGVKLYYRELSLDSAATVTANGGALIRIVPEPASSGIAGVFAIAATMTRRPKQRGVR